MKKDACERLAGAYHRLARFQTRAIGGALGVAIRYESVRRYVAAYVAEHGRLPVHSHLVPQVVVRPNTGKPTLFSVRFPNRRVASLVTHGVPVARDEVWAVRPVPDHRAFESARERFIGTVGHAKLEKWLDEQIAAATRMRESGQEL